MDCPGCGKTYEKVDNLNGFGCLACGYSSAELAPYPPYMLRVRAKLFDFAILVPFAWLPHFFVSSRTLALISSAFSLAFLYSFYSIALHAIDGQTLGKKWQKIRVVSLEQDRITWTKSILRSLPELVLTLANFILLLQFFRETTFFELSPDQQTRQILNFRPLILQILFQLYIVTDLVVLLRHPKSRAAHDLIAGTIVTQVHEE